MDAAAVGINQGQNLPLNRTSAGNHGPIHRVRFPMVWADGEGDGVGFAGVKDGDVSLHEAAAQFRADGPGN